MYAKGISNLREYCLFKGDKGKHLIINKWQKQIIRTNWMWFLQWKDLQDMLCWGNKDETAVYLFQIFLYYRTKGPAFKIRTQHTNLYNTTLCYLLLAQIKNISINVLMPLHVILSSDFIFQSLGIHVMKYKSLVILCPSCTWWLGTLFSALICRGPKTTQASGPGQVAILHAWEMLYL